MRGDYSEPAESAAGAPAADECDQPQDGRAELPYRAEAPGASDGEHDSAVWLLGDLERDLAAWLTLLSEEARS